MIPRSGACAMLVLGWSLFLGLAGTASAQEGSPPAATGRHGDAAQKQSRQEGYKEFLDKVNGYNKLRDAQRGNIPGLNKKYSAEQIQKHQQTLSEKMQQARKEAKPGDIFTANAQKSFRHTIQKVYSRKHATVNRTIAQGEPLKVDLYVNKLYPEKLPITTVPPTLLQHFPRLPRKIEYRIVGNDLVLEDTEANLVIDILEGAFPEAPPHS